jgi:hypothetical protein
LSADTAAYPRTWGSHEIPVPYVTAWTGEPVLGMGMSVRPDRSGLCFEDEQPSDRDHRGVLWARLRNAPGEGTPKFPVMHSARQRRVMENLLCQVCGRPSSRTSRGWLFLLPHEPAEGDRTIKPPVCEPCATLAVHHCPRLTNPVAVRVHRPRVWGVFGDKWARGPGGGLVAIPTNGYLPYGDAEASRWFLAAQLVLELERCTRVPLPDVERTQR